MKLRMIAGGLLVALIASQCHGYGREKVIKFSIRCVRTLNSAILINPKRLKFAAGTFFEHLISQSYLSSLLHHSVLHSANKESCYVML